MVNIIAFYFPNVLNESTLRAEKPTTVYCAASQPVSNSNKNNGNNRRKKGSRRRDPILFVCFSFVRHIYVCIFRFLLLICTKKKSKLTYCMVHLSNFVALTHEINLAKSECGAWRRETNDKCLIRWSGTKYEFRRNGNRESDVFVIFKIVRSDKKKKFILLVC